MVIRYIGNMIAFLCCHYAYLSITITSKLSALNHNKILYYCNCHATISCSVHTFASFFGSCENKLRHYKRSRDLRCITPGIVRGFCCAEMSGIGRYSKNISYALCVSTKLSFNVAVRCCFHTNLLSCKNFMHLEVNYLPF